MLYGYRCIEEDCEYEWDEEGYGYPDNCPECGSEEIEETYELECEDCNCEFIGSENDECPECGGLDTYEID